MRETRDQTGYGACLRNMVGGQDELVFDGASFALDRRGEVVVSSRFSSRRWNS